MASELRRIQFIVSGPFLLLLLLAAGFMTAGFWLYTHQPPPPKPQSPAYYVNHTLTAIRPCYQCVATDGKLKATPEWKLGKTVEIPTGEQWWFAPVEDPPAPTKIDGIPMLAVYPARDNTKPWEGFDQRRIMLVVLQDVDGRFTIEHPAPPPPAQADAPPPSPAPDAPATQPAQ
jgi:hypothetical protein